jgi:hypothetical protein
MTRNQRRNEELFEGLFREGYGEEPLGAEMSLYPGMLETTTPDIVLARKKLVEFVSLSEMNERIQRTLLLLNARQMPLA